VRAAPEPAPLRAQGAAGGAPLTAPSRLREQDARLLRRTRHRRRPALAIGVLLVAVGLAYLGWAALRFEWGLAGEATAFDRPVAGVAQLVAKRRAELDAMEATTPRETWLLTELKAQTDVSVRLLLLVIRVLLASALVLVGGLLLAAADAQRPLLRLIDRLLAPS
jgi:uncharacterized membrane protein YidH (DUF202 family)